MPILTFILSCDCYYDIVPSIFISCMVMHTFSLMIYIAFLIDSVQACVSCFRTSYVLEKKNATSLVKEKRLRCIASTFFGKKKKKSTFFGVKSYELNIYAKFYILKQTIYTIKIFVHSISPFSIVYYIIIRDNI